MLFSFVFLAGALIGKGGGIIVTMQRETGVHLKIGSVDEVFPGTSNRVTLIKGSAANVRIALRQILEILYQARAHTCLGRVCGVLVAALCVSLSSSRCVTHSRTSHSPRYPSF